METRNGMCVARYLLVAGSFGSQRSRKRSPPKEENEEKWRVKL